MSKLKPRKIELLAPAKNLECGIEAIRNGADAVYIGASGFGARANAGNSLEDIKKLCDYAHLFSVRIYVTFNTLLKENELKAAETLIHEIYKAGADALIIQDVAIFEMDLPPIPLHASTQMDLRTINKISFFEKKGISQVVLPREMSIKQIATISKKTELSLEAFIHGALCVSYSGQCYISQALKGRSANRGECAQICRFAFDLIDAKGKVLVKNQHLLSLKDLNRTDSLEQMLDAGVSSLKIEGRLKDASYVKNITAHYRMKLDEIMARREEYVRSSCGDVQIDFSPRPEKSFNRGFTTYQTDSERDYSSFETPKSRGEFLGRVKGVQKRSFTLDSNIKLNNGDGILFFNSAGQQEGIRINRIDQGEIFPAQMPSLEVGANVYRNYDHHFEKTLAKESKERKIGLTIELSDTESGFLVKVCDENEHCCSFELLFEHQESKKENSAYIAEQLSRLGNSIFYCQACKITFSKSRFVPGSLLSEIRRRFVEEMTQVLLLSHQTIQKREERKDKQEKEEQLYPQTQLSYLGNVYNSKARHFFAQNGVKEIAPAFEKKPENSEALMFTKLCLKYSNGWCPVHQKSAKQPQEPLFLKTDAATLELKFDCKNCQMLVFLKK